MKKQILENIKQNILDSLSPDWKKKEAIFTVTIKGNEFLDENSDQLIMANKLSFFYLPCEHQQKSNNLRLLFKNCQNSSLATEVKNTIQQYEKNINYQEHISDSKKLMVAKLVEDVQNISGICLEVYEVVESGNILD